MSNTTEKPVAMTSEQLIRAGVTVRLAPKGPALPPMRVSTPSADKTLGVALTLITTLVRALAIERNQDPAEMWRNICLGREAQEMT